MFGASRQYLDASGPKLDPNTEILTQRSWDRDLAEVVLQDPDRSDPSGSWYKWSKGSSHSHRDPETQILHKLSSRILIQWSNRIPIQWFKRILIQRSCTSGPRGSWHKRSKGPWYRDLVQVVLQDPDTSGPKISSYRDPETQILYKLSHRILIQRSRTSAPIGSWYSGPKDPATEILYKCSYRILIQVVQRILTQRSWNRDLAQVVPQDLDTEILHKWS